MPASQLDPLPPRDVWMIHIGGTTPATTRRPPLRRLVKPDLIASKRKLYIYIVIKYQNFLPEDRRFGAWLFAEAP